MISMLAMHDRDEDHDADAELFGAFVHSEAARHCCHSEVRPRSPAMPRSDAAGPLGGPRRDRRLSSSVCSLDFHQPVARFAADELRDAAVASMRRARPAGRRTGFAIRRASSRASG